MHIASTNPLKLYGTENLGHLRTVLLHCSDQALRRVNAANYKYYLFDTLPDADRYLEEHEQYQKLLQSYGVEVLLLQDYVHKHTHLLHTLPNLAYLHDIALVSRNGYILSPTSSASRRGEDIVVGEALDTLGIHCSYRFEQRNGLKGVLMLSPDTLLIAVTEKYSRAYVERFLPTALENFNEVLYVIIPEERWFTHPDMIYSRISEHLSMVFLPAFLHTYRITTQKRTEINFEAYMHHRGIELVHLSDEEQKRWGCSFVLLKPNVILQYDIALHTRTISRLQQNGVKIIHFHPTALLSREGSLKCLTLQVYREP